MTTTVTIQAGTEHGVQVITNEGRWATPDNIDIIDAGGSRVIHIYGAMTLLVREVEVEVEVEENANTDEDAD